MYHEIVQETLSSISMKDKLVEMIKNLIEFIKHKLIDFGRQLNMTNRIDVSSNMYEAFQELITMYNELLETYENIIKIVRDKKWDSMASIQFESIEKLILKYQERLKKIEDCIQQKSSNKKNIDYRDIKIGLTNMNTLKNTLEISLKVMPNLREEGYTRSMITKFILVLSKWCTLSSSILYAGKGKSIITENYIYYDEWDIAIEASYFDLFQKSIGFNKIMIQRKKKIKELKKDKTKDHTAEIISIYNKNIQTLNQLKIDTYNIEENLLTVSIVDGMTNFLCSLVSATSISNLLIMTGGIGTAHIPKVVVLAASALAGIGQAAITHIGQKKIKGITNSDSKVQSGLKSKLLKKINDAIIVEEYWRDLEKEGFGLH